MAFQRKQRVVEEKTEAQKFRERLEAYLIHKEQVDHLSAKIDTERQLIIAYLEGNVDEDVGSRSRTVDIDGIRASVSKPKDTPVPATNAIELLLEHADAETILRYCFISAERLERAILDGVVPESLVGSLFRYKSNTPRLTVRRVRQEINHDD